MTNRERAEEIVRNLARQRSMDLEHILKTEKVLIYEIESALNEVVKRGK